LAQASEKTVLSFPTNPHTGKIGSARLRIRIVAPDFDVAGENERTLDVPLKEYSKLLSFLLSPKKTGPCRINGEVFDTSKVCLGSIPLQTEVGGDVNTQTPHTAHLVLVVNVGAPDQASKTPIDAKPKKNPRTRASGGPLVELTNYQMLAVFAACSGSGAAT